MDCQRKSILNLRVVSIMFFAFFAYAPLMVKSDPRVNPIQQDSIVTHLVRGTVQDKDNEPLPGVTILLKGTNSGVVTDMNGKYTITIPATGNPVLVFTFIGMKKEEERVAGRKVINVVLEEEQTAVEEVVVTGIYSRKKESFTG